MIISDEYSELFRTIVDTSHDGIIILDNFKISFTNIMFQNMLNFSDDELLDTNITDYIFKEDLILLKDNIIMADKTPHYTSHIKIRFVNKFGETLFTELTIKKMNVQIGHKIIITAVDISYLIDQEDMENRYNRNLKFLNTTAMDFIKMVNIEDIHQHVIIKINEMLKNPIIITNVYNENTNKAAVFKTSGIDSVLSKILTFLKIYPEKIVMELPGDIKTKLSAGRLNEVEGGFFELTFGKIPGFAAAIIEKTIMMDKLYTIGLSYMSNIYGSVAIVTRKKSSIDKNLIETFINQASAAIHRITLEKELNGEKIFQTKLIENSPFPLLLADKEGLITFASKNISNVTGYNHKEIIGSCVSSYVNELYIKILKRHIRLLNKKSPASNIYLIKHKESKEIFCEIIADIIEDPNGNKKYIIAVNDITERINYESKLEEAKNRAEQSDKLKTAFLSNLSHEIRTPLNGIIGFSELLKNNVIEPEEQSQFIDIINNSGKQLLTLINDIIDISRIESGEMTVDLEEFNIRETFKELSEYFNVLKGLEKYSDKSVSILFKPDENLGNDFIISDKNKLTQIMTNLLMNSFKFTKNGFIEFSYTLHNKSMLKITVKDTGIGIASAMQKAVFERFTQADNSGTKKHSGSGLGLSISKSLVELLGGSIHLESVEGKGTTVYFYLPFRNGTSKGVKKECSCELPAHRDIKIMIAEDDDNNYRFLSVFIFKNFYSEAIRARNGIEAVEIFRKRRDIEIIFMDMNMPEMDGYEAVRLIREFDNDVIIIANTAYATTSDKDKCFECGCNDYISKPVNIEKLSEMIKKYARLS